MDHREVLFEQFVVESDFHGGGEFLSKRARRGLELNRPHIGRWRIDQIARQRLTLSNRLDARCVHTGGRDHPRC